MDNLRKAGTQEYKKDVEATHLAKWEVLLQNLGGIARNSRNYTKNQSHDTIECPGSVSPIQGDIKNDESGSPRSGFVSPGNAKGPMFFEGVEKSSPYATSTSVGKQRVAEVDDE
eukprot:Gb_24497 [translate_table: standard]